ncbi:MAG: UDP-2,3-diacylglucosamine diphosphatase [Geopsychrobacter sp.]|nr:UDP-2,3-diacylglucosamine diphosphatase [Geopsychrobacter sp.]
MRAIFIADAHLRHPHDQNYRKLLDFLDQQQGNLDALFLLGDIFEFWIGYHHVVFSEHLPLLSRLQQLSEKGCRLFYVEGNHDFNLGSFFSEKLTCQVIPDQQVIDWDGQKIFICHGDLANPRDKSYILMRKFWRSRFVKFLTRVVPPDSAWRLGNFLCDLSRKKQHQRRNPEELVLPYAKQALAQGADKFVCGHFHFPLQTKIDGGQMTVLGDWIQQFSYLELINGEARLKSYKTVSASAQSSAT